MKSLKKMNRDLYPKPSEMGGVLIRRVISGFKKNAFSVPIREPVLIATSGGVDSMVLAHLLSRYGRRCILPECITLLHFDHQWRKESGGIEKEGVEKLAQLLGVKWKSVKLLPPVQEKGQKINFEEDARIKRNAYYCAHAGEGKLYRYVFTAHHQDDLAETLLWRFLRGEFFESTAGILFNDDPILRPLLQVSKSELECYAREEKLRYFEDPGNGDLSQMRVYLRKVLFPLLVERFPRVKATLAAYALQATEPLASVSSQSMIYALEQLTSKLSRTQKGQIMEAVRDVKQKFKVILPGGVILKREKSGFFIEFQGDDLKKL